MRALLLLPLQRLILTVRLRITEHIFHYTQTNKKTTWISLFLGGICALGLWLYIPLISSIGMTTFDYTDTQLYPSLVMLMGLLLYILIIIGINYMTSSLRLSKQSHIHQTTLIIKEIIIRSLLVGGTYYILGHTSLTPIFIYYLLVAGSEEGLKYISSISLSKTSAFSTSDLILFSLLIALGFAFFENIIYMFQSTQAITTWGQQLTSGTSILLSRGLIGFLVHMLFTGSIAYISVKGIQQQKNLRLILALLVGILLHMSYNILLYYNITIIIGLYLLGGYFLLSYLFYQSDGIYLSS